MLDEADRMFDMEFVPQGEVSKLEKRFQKLELDRSGSNSIGEFVSVPKWKGFKAATKKQKYEKISEKKMSTTVEVGLKVREYELRHDNSSENGKFGFGKVNLYFRFLAAVCLQFHTYFLFAELFRY